jgi:rhodanese-related sulfurtransferase
VAGGACVVYLLLEAGEQFFRLWEVANLPDLREGMTISERGNPFCRSSMTVIIVAKFAGQPPAERHFLEKLVEWCRRHDLPVYLAPRAARPSAWPFSASDSDGVLTLEESQLGAKAAHLPAIIVVDCSGRVLRLWSGPRATSLATDILQYLAKEFAWANPRLQQLADRQLAELGAHGDFILLDVRERSSFTAGHLRGALNIPYLELALRAPVELNRQQLQVVDCSRIPVGLCDAMLHALRQQGFQAVSLLRGVTLCGSASL